MEEWLFFLLPVAAASGWFAARRHYARKYLIEHTGGGGGGGASGGAGADLAVEALVAQQLAAFGGREGVRRDGPNNIVNHLLWIQRILAFVANFLEHVSALNGRERAETWTAARAAYAAFFSPFHIAVLQWLVPPLLGLVPRKASMLASMGPMAEADGDAAAADLVRDGLAPLAARLHTILKENDLLFTDKAGQTF